MADEIEVSCTTTNGTLYVGGQVMHRPAFAVMDVTPLWQGPAQRGTNLLIPGRPGTIAMPKRATETITAVRMLIDGRYSVAGTATGDSDQGLFDNVMWLRANVANPTTGHSLTLYEPSGLGSISGIGQIMMVLGERVGPLWRAVLEITLPEGYLA